MSASWDEARRDSRLARSAGGGPLWHFLRGFIKHPVMVGSVIPSSKAMIDKMLAPGRLGELQVVRRIWPGRRHLHRACPPAHGARRDPDRDRHQRGFHPLSDPQVPRQPAARGHRLGRRRPRDHRRLRLRPCRLHPLRPALLDPAARHRAARSPRRPRRRSAPAAPSWSINSRPRCASSWRPISTGSTRASNGSTCRPATCSGAGRADRHPGEGRDLRRDSRDFCPGTPAFAGVTDRSAHRPLRRPKLSLPKLSRRDRL